MARPPLLVRPATVEDLPALLALSDELRDQLLPTGESGRPRASGVVTRGLSSARYCDAIEDPDRHLVVVVDCREDEQVLGMALLTVAPANALVDLPAVHMSHAVVSDRHRRRGAGRALVAFAAAFAEEHDVEQLVVSVNPGSREANRFFARLGFTPLAVRRSAPVAAVRRRLAASDVRPVEHVARTRRRSLRPRVVGMPIGGVPLGPSLLEDDC